MSLSFFVSLNEDKSNNKLPIQGQNYNMNSNILQSSNRNANKDKLQTKTLRHFTRRHGFKYTKPTLKIWGCLNIYYHSFLCEACPPN